MKELLNMLFLLLTGLCAAAQTKPVPPISASIVSVIEGITSKHFQPDTTYAALSEEDAALLAKEPVANWSLLQESGEMTYSNLVVGTRSYQLVIIKPAKTGVLTATLLRFVTAKSKPEPIARGTLQPKEQEKPK